MNLFENLQIMKENGELVNNMSDIDHKVDYIIDTLNWVSKYGFENESINSLIDKMYKLSSVIEDAINNKTDVINENTELRQFDGRDSAAWGGVHDFADGSKPMIVDGEFATILIGQSDEQVGTGEATISIYYGDPENPHWCFKGYDNKEDAIKDATLLSKLADDEIDESQLKRFGFTFVV